MSDLETRLHDLADLDPGPVEAERLSSGARHSAARHRRRVVTGLAVAVLAVTGILASTVLGRGDLRADVPADHRSVQVGPADEAMCSVAPNPYRAPIGAHGLSRDFRAAALCPTDPTDPASDALPVPAVVHGQFLDGVAIPSGGPPVTTCDAGRPALPDFHVLLVSEAGVPYVLDNSSFECGGALVAQSFAGRLAEERFMADADPGSACTVIRRLGPLDPPQQFSDVASVDVCVLADPYTEAEPRPLRFRPLRQVTLSPAERQAVLDGLAGATRRAERFTECPWRHVVGGGRRDDRQRLPVLGAAALHPGLQPGRHRAAGPDGGPLADPRRTGQAVLEREVAAYLEARPVP